MSDDTKINRSLNHGTQHAKELEALYRISRLINAGIPQKQMFAEVLDILATELGMTSGTITLVSPDNRELLVEVAHNLPEKKRLTARYRIGEGITGRVVETGKPAIIPKVSQEPMFLDRLRKRKKITKEEIGFICVPIIARKEIIGAFSVDRIFNNMPPEEDLRVLSIVASMIAHDIQFKRESVAARQRLEEENLRLRHELEDRYKPENIIGNSGAMREVYSQIHQVASSDTTVLVHGESGTGKELVAYAVHFSSPRAKGSFVKINCAALSENLLESELFGHEKGAFTGAIQMRKGRIEEAEGGTLFLDEIGDFTQTIQVKLLRILQEREYERVGSNQTKKANIRIIAATNRNLEAAVDSGDFRLDLYYRINVFPIHIPPLHERKDDILLLADFFIERYAKQMNKDIRRITTPAINMMVAYHWPGNVRELENCIERGVLLSSDGVIHGHHLPPSLQTSDASDTVGAGSLHDRVTLFERDIIVDALKRTNGNISSCARDLNTTARIIRYKMSQLGIEPEKYKRHP